MPQVGGALIAMKPCSADALGISSEHSTSSRGLGLFWAGPSRMRRLPGSRGGIGSRLKAPSSNARYCGRSSLGWHGVHFGSAAMSSSLGGLMLFCSLALLRSTSFRC